MRRSSLPVRIGAGLGTIGLVAIALLVSADRASAQPAVEVTLCHRTAAVSNPYTQLTVSANSIDIAGHGSHTGPLFPNTEPPNSPSGVWGDIIPPVPSINFPGLNWTGKGKAIWNAACVVHETEPPIPPTTTTTTTTPGATTTTTTPGATTTTTPGATTTTTPGATTTTTPGATTPTTPGATTTSPPTSPTTPPPPPTGPPPTVSPAPPPPAVTDPPDGVEIVPPTEAEVIDPGDQVVDLGPLDQQERIRLEQEIDPPGAPQAGFGGASASPGPSAGWLTAGGILVAVAGGATFALWRRRRSV